MMQKITIVILALLLLLSIGYAGIKTKEEGSDTMAHEHNNEASEINANGIRAKMCDDISEEFKRLSKKQVDPWIFYNSKGVRVEKFDGTFISHSGVKFGQTSRLVFWKGYIEPFIENVIKRKIEETVKLAKDKKVPLSAVLGSTEANLSGGIDTVYRKMQSVDRRLRGGGDPKSVPMRDISFEIKKMNEFLDRQIKIAEDLHFDIVETSETEPKKEKGAWGFIAKAGLVLGIVVSLMAIFGPFKGCIRKDKIDISKVSNNYIFNFNAPVEVRNVGSQTGILKSPQILSNQEKYFKYLPNGLKRNIDNNIEKTKTFNELNRLFNFMKINFTKTVSGKEVKEMNSLLNQILGEEPDLAYVWFYRGLFFSCVSINPEFKDEFSSIAKVSFEKADDLFNVLHREHPNDPFLLLYKGMNLTFLDRGEESVAYLKKAMSLEPNIFQKKHVLGMISYWKHIAPNYLQEWQTAWKSIEGDPEMFGRK